MNWKSILGTVAPIAAMAIPGLQGLGMTGLAGKVGGGILGKVGKIAGAVSPILGKAAGARAEATRQSGQDQMQRDVINQNAARDNSAIAARRLPTAARANYAMAGPVSVKMGTPGFGKRGETTQFSGGGNAPIDPRMRELASRVMDEQLQNQMTGGDMVPGATPEKPSSFGDKALGAGSFISSLLGGLGTMNKPRITPTFPPTNGRMMPNSGQILRNVQF